MNVSIVKITALCLSVALMAGCSGNSLGSEPTPPVTSQSSTSSETSENASQALADVKIPLVDIGDYIFAAPFSHGYAFVSKSTECGYIDYEGNYTKSMGISVDDLIKFDSSTMERTKNNPFPMSEEGLYPSFKGKNLGDTASAPWSIKNIKTGEALVENLPFAAVFNEGRGVITELSQDKAHTVTRVIDSSG
ncbi:MAG: hypothetical protein RRY40_02155, partial [Oscillospiraceae bacterium]